MFRIHESGSVSETLVLTESKNTNFTKIGGTKKNHGPNSRDTSRTQRPSIKIFSKQEFIQNLEFLGKPAHSGRFLIKSGIYWRKSICLGNRNQYVESKVLYISHLILKWIWKWPRGCPEIHAQSDPFPL